MEDEGHQIAVTVPLFLRKLWKMVNDAEAEDIIGWNSTGDGFVIYNQLQFITKLLPKYFKHNNMASFIRQLNFYDFHKVAGLEKDLMQFTHGCFLKDLPETLVFIKRKCTSLRSKLANNVKDEEVSEILGSVKELKTKHSLVDSEFKLLKQENAALWNEVNSLRLKHAKQTKIINKIIHFLISYIHSQNSLSKGKGALRQRNSANLKTGPTILEIDYDNGSSDVQMNFEQNSTEPGHSGAITYPSVELDPDSLFTNMQPAEHTLDEILNKVGGNTTESKQPSMKVGKTEHLADNTSQNRKSQLLIKSKFSGEPSGDSNTRQPSLQVNYLPNTNSNAMAGAKTRADLSDSIQKKKQSSVQNAVKYDMLGSTKENLGLYLEDTEGELNSLQEILSNLNSSQLMDFGNLIEEAQTEDSTLLESEASGYPEVNDKEMYVEGSWDEGNDEFVEEPTVTMEPVTINEAPVVDNFRNVKTEYIAENLEEIEPDLFTESIFY